MLLLLVLLVSRPVATTVAITAMVVAVVVQLVAMLTAPLQNPHRAVIANRASSAMPLARSAAAVATAVRALTMTTVTAVQAQPRVVTALAAAVTMRLLVESTSRATAVRSSTTSRAKSQIKCIFERQSRDFHMQGRREKAGWRPRRVFPVFRPLSHLLAGLMVFHAAFPSSVLFMLVVFPLLVTLPPRLFLFYNPQEDAGR